MTAPRLRAGWLLAGALLAAIAACDGGSVPATPDSITAADTGAVPFDTTPRLREVVAVELAALADSAAAVRLADSLRTAGWGAVLLRRGAGD